MKSQFFLVYICLLTLNATIQAQSDDCFINGLTGKIDTMQMIAWGNDLPAFSPEWVSKTATGFKESSANARKQGHLDGNWHFFPVANDQTTPSLEKVNIPHSFGGSRDYVKGWYVKRINISKQDNKRYFLMLNRVELFSMVYVNGIRIGHHFGGLTPFEFEISDALVNGENFLTILVYDKSAAVDGDKLYNQMGVSRLSGFNASMTPAKLPGGMYDVPILEERENSFMSSVFIETSTRKNEMDIEFQIDHNAYPEKSTVRFDIMTWPDGELVDVEIPKLSDPNLLTGVQSFTVKWENPDLWSPDHPKLYVLRTTVESPEGTDVLDTRFGFREFWIDGTSFILNGTPVRLRGDSHYRSTGHNVNYHRAIFQMHKELFGINACRVHATMPPGEVMEAADEAGILIVNQSAIWSVNGRWYANGGDRLNRHLRNEFHEWVMRDRNSPSVVIWDVENEMLRFNRDMAYPWVSLLPGYVRELDTTRPVNYSGAGWFGDEQEMVSLHMQEHYTKIMHDWSEKDNRPLIMGEFWVGGRSEQRLPNSPEFSTTKQRYIEEAKVYEEKILEMRYLGVSGIMPFRHELLAFPENPETGNRYTLNAGGKLDYVISSQKVVELLHHALQPVTVFVWPRTNYAVSGQAMKHEVVICNDSEIKGLFDIVWHFEGEVPERKRVELAPAGQEKFNVRIAGPTIPKRLIAKVKQNGILISSDTLDILPLDIPSFDNPVGIQVYKDEALSNKFNQLGLKSISVNSVPDASEDILFVVPDNANNRELTSKKDQLLKYLDDGGRLLSLKQDQAPGWFPIRFNFWSGSQASLHTYARMGWEGINKHIFYSTLAPIYAPDHPVFKGIQSDALHNWDDFDNRVSDDVFARPSSTGIFEQGNWLPLSGGTRREHISLAEINYGKGLLLSCQLNLMENLENPQARTILVNIINYLSQRGPQPFNAKLALAGAISADQFENLSGVSSNSIVSIRRSKASVILAFKGADVDQLKKLATKGKTVIVLSTEIAQGFDNVEMVKEMNTRYLVTKIGDHPLLAGVASANFLNARQNAVTGFFSKLPKNANILLQGFASSSTLWNSEDRGPVMVSFPYGKGEILLSTLDVDDTTSASTKEFLNLLLTNMGVNVPCKAPRRIPITIKKTVPVHIDGKLNEWLEDMEDRLVTPYIHAQPVYLTSESIVEGPAVFDMNLSAINYFIWNEQALHIAGVVFMENKLFGGESMGDNKVYQQQLMLNDDVITISYTKNQTAVFVNGNPLDEHLIATAQIDSKEMTDATPLQFNYIHASGKITNVDHLVGETFELKIPWKMLRIKPTEPDVKGLFSISSRESVIQVPLSGNQDSQEHWWPMIFEMKGKGQ
jgi:hypothetical protein